MLLCAPTGFFFIELARSVFPPTPTLHSLRLLSALGPSKIDVWLCDSVFATAPDFIPLCASAERKRNTSWTQFIRRQKDVLWATDLFTAEVWTATGLTTFHVLFFLHLQTRRIILDGIAPFPKGELKQVAPNHTVDDGPMAKARFLLRDRDTKYSQDFGAVFQSAGIESLKLGRNHSQIRAAWRTA